MKNSRSLLIWVLCNNHSIDLLSQYVGGRLDRDSANSLRAVAAKSGVVSYLSDHCSMSW